MQAQMEKWGAGQEFTLAYFLRFKDFPTSSISKVEVLESQYILEDDGMGGEAGRVSLGASIQCEEVTLGAVSVLSDTGNVYIVTSEYIDLEQTLAVICGSP